MTIDIQMFVIIGFVIVFVTVFGGYLLEGGHLAVLMQPIELLIIGGAAMGGLIASSSLSLLKEILHQILKAFSGKELTKADYLELLLALFELTKLGRTNSLGLEPHIDNPAASDIFKKYPKLTANHHAMDFICDTLKLQVSSPMSPYDLEDIMNADIAALHVEEGRAPETIGRVGDAMPGLGIVAAVLGVVLTMGKLTQGKEVIGHSVAAALVGTFLGILISYGFMQPLQARMNLNNSLAGAYLEVAKAAILAFAKESSPKACVEFARRNIAPEFRPTFKEIDEATSKMKKA